MNTLDAIVNRKSVRSYTGEPTSKDELDTVLKTAYASPVAMGKYGDVSLTVISNKELLQKLDQNAQQTFHTDRSMLYGAPTFIIVSAKLVGSPADNSAYSNGATIVENMNLGAVELGLGACHIWGVIAALNQNQALLKELNIPEGQTPVAGMTLGKTTETYDPRKVDTSRIQTNMID
ncbi:nitroreductase family protein [Lentilactobacillus diolivorans]|uniref:Nitroreductase n=2 Tax=Lentilactobacillus diolivorans TaxID=179838 RepID=A0A0R1S6C5_9LACO|nr:nitroreductase family protein [Lentilactobacillus diolivorans]KRL62394.1 nitroreductase [Lentilactobacillus diolivorans DSM 14421]GEP25162.1 nitroreductase [Lentilactobacillus diolivorans]